MKTFFLILLAAAGAAACGGSTTSAGIASNDGIGISPPTSDVFVDQVKALLGTAAERDEPVPIKAGAIPAADTDEPVPVS